MKILRPFILAASLALPGLMASAIAAEAEKTPIMQFAQANERHSRAYIGRPDPRSYPPKSAQAQKPVPRVLVNRPEPRAKARGHKITGTMPPPTGANSRSVTSKMPPWHTKITGMR